MTGPASHSLSGWKSKNGNKGFPDSWKHRNNGSTAAQNAKAAPFSDQSYDTDLPYGFSQDAMKHMRQGLGEPYMVQTIHHSMSTAIVTPACQRGSGVVIPSPTSPSPAQTGHISAEQISELNYEDMNQHQQNGSRKNGPKQELIFVGDNMGPENNFGAQEDTHTFPQHKSKGKSVGHWGGFGRKHRPASNGNEGHTERHSQQSAQRKRRSNGRLMITSGSQERMAPEDDRPQEFWDHGQPDDSDMSDMKAWREPTAEEMSNAQNGPRPQQHPSATSQPSAPMGRTRAPIPETAPVLSPSHNFSHNNEEFDQGYREDDHLMSGANNTPMFPTFSDVGQDNHMYSGIPPSSHGRSDSEASPRQNLKRQHHDPYGLPASRQPTFGPEDGHAPDLTAPFQSQKRKAHHLDSQDSSISGLTGILKNPLSRKKENHRLFGMTKFHSALSPLETINIEELWLKAGKKKRQQGDGVDSLNAHQKMQETVASLQKYFEETVKTCAKMEREMKASVATTIKQTHKHQENISQQQSQLFSFTKTIKRPRV